MISLCGMAISTSGSALDEILCSREAMEEHFGMCFDSDESDFDVGSLGKHATCKNNNDK